MSLPALKDVKVISLNNGLKTIRICHNGSRKQFYASTKQAVLNKYKEYKDSVNIKPLKALSSPFYMWYEKWLQLYKIDLKENTLNAIKGVFNNYILPHIGKTPLTKISCLNLQLMFNEMYKKVPRQTTVAYFQLNSCLQQAYKLNMISHNPCCAVVIKKDKGKKKDGLTKDQQQKLLEYLKDNYAPVNDLVLIYLNTGIRCSELFSITRADVDRTNNELHIKGTKTISSDRIIQTSKEILNLIPDIDKPFANWNKDKVYREFKKITTALKFKGIGIHSLRHTFATNCIEMGVDMVVLQKWLGHASITMTIDRYTHISDNYKRKQQEKVKFLN